MWQSTDWEHSPFAHLQYLPRNRKPIVTLHNRDKAFLAIAQELRRVIAQQLLPSPPLSRVPRQNRERMLKRVRDFWITGLLDQSLHQAVLLDLHLQDQPDALENPFRLQVQEIGRLPYPLPVGTSIIQVYDEAGGELLILGEPGAGKTTLLLQLTQTLLDRALVDERSPIPVIFNLSSWAQKQEPLARWLAEELKTKYRVNDQIGQHWIAMNQILPLLDGLDEVAEWARIACVRAITAYYLNHPSQVVICCRSEEYQALSLHLPLQRAISVLPLTADQIDRYLSSAQGQLEGLRQALHDDTELSELARRPLMLSIFTLAYQGRAVDDFQVRGSLEEQRQQVFATYVQRMLERRGVSTRYTQKQAKWWLSWLAQQMVRHKQVEFSIEQLQIDWFSGSQRSKLFMLVLCWLVTWITLGSIGGLIIALISRQLTGFLTVLAIELIVVSFYGYYDYSELEGKIEVTEALSWYPEGFWRSAWNSIVSTFKEEPGVYLAGGIFGAVVGLVCGVATGLLYGLPKGLINGVITGLVSGALLMLLAGVVNDMPAKRLDKNIKPNQGIWRSAYISLSVALGFMLFLGLPTGVFSGLSQGQPIGLVSGVICGFLFGTFFGLVAGGSCIKHVYLRFLLWCARSIPWDYVQFLDYATERLLLRKVGGGYIFVHRLLLDYFADEDSLMSTKSTSKARKVQS